MTLPTRSITSLRGSIDEKLAVISGFEPEIRLESDWVAAMVMIVVVHIYHIVMEILRNI